MKKIKLLIILAVITAVLCSCSPGQLASSPQPSTPDNADDQAIKQFSLLYSGSDPLNPYTAARYFSAILVWNVCWSATFSVFHLWYCGMEHVRHQVLWRPFIQKREDRGSPASVWVLSEIFHICMPTMNRRHLLPDSVKHTAMINSVMIDHGSRKRKKYWYRRQWKLFYTHFLMEI